MADDAIFDEGQGSEAQGQGPASGGEGEGGGEAAASNGIDPKVLEQAFGNAMNPLLQRIESLEQRIQQGASNGSGESQGRSSGGEESGVGDQKGTLERFVEDADAVFEEQGKRIVQQIAPALQPLLSEAQERTTQSEKQYVDERFGEGTFDEKVVPRLEYVIKNAPGTNRANPQFIRSAVASILGMRDMQDDLFERRQKRIEEERRAERQRSRPPQFVGAGRMVASRPSDEPDEASREFLQNLGRTLSSTDFDEERFKKVRNAPRSYSERMKYFKEKGIPIPGSQQSGAPH